jgi:hypothetical protein
MLKLTSKEQDFVNDVRILIERGDTTIDLKQFCISGTLAMEILKQHLGVDVWFSGVKPPFEPVIYTIETVFSKRYIFEMSKGKCHILTPKPFELLMYSYPLEVSVEAINQQFQNALATYKGYQNGCANVKPWYKKIFA